MKKRIIYNEQNKTNEAFNYKDFSFRFNRRTFLGKFVSLLAAIQLIPTSVIKIKNSFKRFIKENESEKTWIFTPDEVEIYLPENADQGIIWGCRDFIKDCEEATGKKPEIINTLSGRGKLAILPAVVDGNNQLNRFEKTGLIDLSKVRGNWESYVIQPITDLGKNNPNILVVAGSVPRAVAYGLYEISEKLFGTDPLKLWTDFIPDRKEKFDWKLKSYFHGPSVKYRGYFINDEKFLLNWIKVNDGRIEPEIWARIIETAARTRANFVSLPDEYNKVYLDHASRTLLAERDMFLTGNHIQSLLVQTTEFPDFCKRHGYPEQWSWITNRKAMLAFWEYRVAYNSKFRNNIWPIGLRAMNDTDYSQSDPAAPKSPDKMVVIMNEVIAAQIELLEKYIDKNDIVTTYTMRGEPYNLYRTGKLKLPDNCILVWGDDGSTSIFPNLPDETEQERKGGNGTYYHLTYCDNNYVQWVSPKIIRQEYLKAIDRHKCTAYVMHNVGNIRELPLSIASGFDIVKNIKPWKNDNYDQTFTSFWITQHFEPEENVKGNQKILDIYNRYFTIERSMRCESVIEVVRPYVFNCVHSNHETQEAMKKWMTEAKFDEGGRLNVSETKLFKDELLWESLRKDGYAAIKYIHGRRRQFYMDRVLLDLETSAGINRYAVSIRRAINAALDGNKPGVISECNKAHAAMILIGQKRKNAMHGKWRNWFRGAKHWGVNCKWTICPKLFAEEVEEFKQRLIRYIEI